VTPARCQAKTPPFEVIAEHFLAFVGFRRGQRVQDRSEPALFVDFSNNGLRILQKDLYLKRNLNKKDHVMATETEKKETHICVICCDPFTGYGNNPHPVKFTGRCCDTCNDKYVIPARFMLAAAK
jgi:hypothetical protein